MYQIFLSAGLVLAWLVTPDTLRVVDMTSGMSGIYALVSILFGAVLAISSSALIHSPLLAEKGYDGDLKVLREKYGDIIAFSMLLCGRIPLLLFGSTGLLVIAGFAFNEIFLYWFPNFLFAFVLLGVVVAANLISTKYGLLIQPLFVAMALAGLTTLVVIGFWAEPVISADFKGQQQGFIPTLFALGAICFLGFDFYRGEQGYKGVLLAILLGLLVLLFWSITALKFASPTRLVESTIGHMIIARVIADDLGRMVMGGVVISGVLAGVNGLFIVASRLYRDFGDLGMVPKKLNANWPITLFFSVVIGLMMITGFAGEAILEEQIKGSVVLWLLYLGLRNFAAASLLRGAGKRWAVGGYCIGTLFILIGLILVSTSLQIPYVVGFIFVMLVGATGLSSVWLAVHKRQQ